MDRTVAWRAAIVAAALILLWRIIAVNAVSYDVAGRPVAPATAGRDATTARLRENPADVASLVAQARSDAAEGNVARAGAELAAASAIAPIDAEALEAGAAALFSQGRTREGAARLSKIAATYGKYDRLFPVFARMLAGHEPSLFEIAAENPRWLGPFILDQCAKVADPLALVALLQVRSNGTGRPLPAEVDCVTERLRFAGRWTEAYQAWLNTLPRERLGNVGFVFNGSFEYPASGVGFDWKPDRTPERYSGHAIELAPSREGRGERALRITYTGKRQVLPAVVQYLATPPGSYEIVGWARVDHLNSPRGVRWVLRCASDENTPVISASERFLGSSEWRRFAFDVDIPAGCAGQALQLEPVGMDQGTTFLAGNVWFDDLTLAQRR